MSVLVDTNILLRAAQPGHDHHHLAVKSVSKLRGQKTILCLARQNLYEFWAVATRPNDANGLNYNHEQAIGELSVLKKIYHLIDDIPAIYPAWENLVRDHEVKGKNAHDARLVAAMNVHGVNQILTFNESDFSRYDGVTVLTPAAVLS